jgi:DnaD/phage-associated family protein
MQTQQRIEESNIMRHLSGNKLFADEFFGMLKPIHRLLWLGLILTLADDQGRLPDNATLMRSQLFPYDNITDKDIEKGLVLFEAKHKISRYAVGTNGSGKLLIQIVNWWKYQAPQWAKESGYPAPRNWADRIRTHKEGYGSQPYTLNWETPGGFIAATKPLPSRKLADKVAASKPLPSRDRDIDDSLKTLSSLSKGALEFFSKKTGKIEPAQEADLSTLLSGGISPGWIDEAIAIASSKNKHSAHYVIGILKNWKLEGRNESKLSPRKTSAKSHRTADTQPGSQPNDRTRQAAELINRKRSERAKQSAT